MKTHINKLKLWLAFMVLLGQYVHGQNTSCSTALNISNGVIQNINSFNVKNWTKFTASQTSHEVVVWVAQDSIPQDLDSVFVFSGTCSGLTLVQAISVPTGDAAVFTMSGLSVGSKYYVVANRDIVPGCPSCTLSAKVVSFYVQTSTSSCTDMVFNGSFEQHGQLPYCAGSSPQWNGSDFYMYTVEMADGWTTQYASINAYIYNNSQQPGFDPTQPHFATSSDYLHTSTGNIGCLGATPAPRTGSAHAGMAFTSDMVNGLAYKEMVISDHGTNVPVVAGRSYTLSFYVKRDIGNTNCTFGVYATGNLTQSVIGSGTQYTCYTSPAANGWTKVDCFITAGWSGAFQFGIIYASAAFAPNVNNYFFVDDVSMYESVILNPASNLTTCAGYTANMVFSASGATSYSWSISPSATISPNGNTCWVTTLPTQGTYTLTVSGTTPSGCPSTASIVLTANPTPTVSITPTSATICIGTGSVLLTASPNNSQYTYQWYNQNSAIPGATGLTYLPFSSGTYHCEVTNTYGCIGVSNNATITYNPSPQVGIMSATPQSCSGANDGSILSGAMGGTAPYTYSWNTSPVQTTNYATGLVNGTYTVTVTDANGCTGWAAANVGTLPAPPVPIIASNANVPNLCADQQIIYTITNYDPQWNYIPSYNIPPVNVNQLSANTYQVNWGQSCDDVIFTVTVDNGSGNPFCDATASLEIDGCCACDMKADDAIMTGSPGSKNVWDLYNAYNSVGYVTQSGNNYYYSNPSGVLYINGDFLVPNNVNFELIGSEVKFGSNAAVYLMGNATLTVNGSYLHAGCNDMWDGVYISVAGGFRSHSSSRIEDAIHAVVSIGGGNYQITETIFNKNWIDIDVLFYTGAHSGSVTNSVFSCRDLPVGVTIANVKGAQNSSAFIQVYPIASYPVATLLPPYAGKRGYSGVYVNSNGSTTVGSNYEVTSFDGLTVGDVAGGYNDLNVFDNKDFGVYSHYSNFIVQNCAFQYMSGPTALAKNAPNYGIAVYGITFSELESAWVAHIGGDNGRQNTFFECNRSVDLNGYYDVEVNENRFQSRQIYNPAVQTLLPTTGSFGVFVKSGYYIEIEINKNDIVNWTTPIAFYADVLPASPGQYYKFMGNAYINDNRVSPVETNSSAITTEYVTTPIVTQNIIPPCSNCLQQMQIGRLYIERNDLNQVFNGIVVQQWIKRPRIADNQIYLRYQAPYQSSTFNQAGIRLIKNNTSVVYRNTIIGDAQAINKLNVRGIYATGNTNAPIWCNVMDNVGQCMVYEGNCLGSQIYNNEMYAAQDGFVLLNNGVVGAQGGFPSLLNPNGKACDNYWYGPFSHADTYTDQTFTPDQHSPLFVRDPSLNPAYVPVVNLTTGQAATDDYNATNAINIIVTPAPSIDCGQPPAIAEADLPDDEKEGKQMVMEKIVQDSLELTGDFNEEGWAAKKGAYEMLSEDSTLLDGSTVLQDFYTEAGGTSIGQTVEVTELLGNNELSEGAVTNTSITPEVTADQNQQIVHAIYVEVMNGTALTDSQWVQLETIAALCPLQGGEGVYRARTLLALLNDNYVVYEDTCSTVSSNQRRSPRSSAQVVQDSKYTVYPNPTSGYLNIQYVDVSSQPVYFTVYDLTGRVVYEVLLPPTVQLYVADLSFIADGMYQYAIGTKEAVYRSDKITITH